MKKFLAIYLGTTNGENMKKWNEMNPETKKEMTEKGMRAWGEWMSLNASKVVEVGSPLGKTKKVDKSGVSDTKNEMGGWVVVEAETHEEAAKLFENHPHFMIFPGDSIEVMECLPMPGM